MDRTEYLSDPATLLSSFFANTHRSSLFSLFLDPKIIPFQQSTRGLNRIGIRNVNEHNDSFIKICTNFLGKYAADDGRASDFLKIPEDDINLIVNDKPCKNWRCFWLDKIDVYKFLGQLETKPDIHIFLWFWLKVNILIATISDESQKFEPLKRTCSETFSYLVSYLISLFDVMSRVESIMADHPDNFEESTEVIQEWVNTEMKLLSDLDRHHHVLGLKVCGVSYQEHYTHNVKRPQPTPSPDDSRVLTLINEFVGHTAFDKLIKNPEKYSITFNTLKSIFGTYSNLMPTHDDHSKLWKSMYKLSYLKSNEYPTNEFMATDKKFSNYWNSENVTQDDLPDFGTHLLSCNLTKNTNGCSSKPIDMFSKILSTAFPHHCQIRAISDIIQDNYSIVHTTTKLEFKTPQESVEYIKKLNETCIKLTDFVDKLIICSMMALYDTESSNFKQLFWTGDQVGITRMLKFHQAFITNKVNRKKFILKLCKNKDTIRTIVQEYLILIVEDYDAFKSYLMDSVDWSDTKDQTTQCTAGVFKIALTYDNFNFGVTQNANVMRKYIHEDAKIPGEPKDPNKRNVHYDQAWHLFMKTNRWYNTKLQRKSYWFDESLFKCLNKVYRLYFTVDMFFTSKATSIIAPLDQLEKIIVAQYCTDTKGLLIQNDEALTWIDMLGKCGMVQPDQETCKRIYGLYVEKQSDGKIINELWKLSRKGFNLLFNLVLDKLNGGFINFIDSDIDTAVKNSDALMANRALGFPFMKSRICYTNCCKRLCNYTVPNSYGFIDVAMKLASKNRFECIKHKKHGTWERKSKQYERFEGVLKKKANEYMKKSIDKQTRKYLRSQYGNSMGIPTKPKKMRDHSKSKLMSDDYVVVDPSWFGKWDQQLDALDQKSSAKKRPTNADSLATLSRSEFVGEFVKTLMKDMKTFTNKQAKRYYGLNIIRNLERDTKATCVDDLNKICLYRNKKQNDFIQNKRCQTCCLLSKYNDAGWMGGTYHCSHCIDQMK